MSLVSDVTHQVKHPPTCTIHSPFTGGLKLKCFLFITSKLCANEDMLCTCVIQFGIGSSSFGSGGVERGRATNRLQRWQCGGIMHDMLKKGSWCVPLSKA